MHPRIRYAQGLGRTADQLDALIRAQDAIMAGRGVALKYTGGRLLELEVVLDPVDGVPQVLKVPLSRASLNIALSQEIRDISQTLNHGLEEAPRVPITDDNA